MKLLKIFPYLFFLGYLAVGLLTLPNYGINWDEPAHFLRGHTFLHYILTGQKNFDLFPPITSSTDNAYLKGFVQDFGYVFTDKDLGTVIRRSMYQRMPFSFYIDDIANRGNHPVFSDIMAAASNYIFFQKLGIVSDVYSHNFYPVFLSSILVLATFLWVRKIFGGFAAIISSLSLALFPLFWAESHYNVKDIPETVFYSLAIYLFYIAVTELKIKYLILFSAFGAMAFATKFNFLFSAFILIPWGIFALLMYLKREKMKLQIFVKKNKWFLLFGFCVPIIFIIFWIGTYPASWFEPKLLLASFNYYKSIGTASNIGFSAYPLYYILFATPLVILLLTIFGVIGGLKLKGQRKLAFFLILLWFIVPIIRVIVPNTVIYGGVRQIMEYIPAMAILAGIGGTYVVKLLNNSIVLLLKKHKQFSNKAGILSQLIIIISFIPITLTLISIHPNEGVYFNSLIGGLKGAEQAGIPNAGQTLGNEYRQAILWLNKNAEPNAKLALGHEYLSNLPVVWIRNDITYNDRTFSGPLQKGEYVISYVQIKDKLAWYTMRYLENYLIPAYIVSVDGIPLVKVWKNDPEHTKNGYLENEQVKNVSFVTDESSIEISLPIKRFVTRLEFNIPDETCKKFEKFAGRFIIKKANIDENPLILPAIDFNIFNQLPYQQPFYLLAAEEARSIRFELYSPSPCIQKIQSVNVYSLKNNQH